MTFNSFPRGFFTIMGDTVVKSAAELEKEGVGGRRAPTAPWHSEQMAGCVQALAGSDGPAHRRPGQRRPARHRPGRHASAYSQTLEDYIAPRPGDRRAGAGLRRRLLRDDPVVHPGHGPDSSARRPS
ncbi:MAG: hypothetical protein MZV65_40645 [Chromatiales bacterium]|nr:hypothetical protein [Chromatiales bacterium]